MTFFPWRGAHNGDLLRDRVISIGFVNENHWVQVKLKSACPLPPLAWHWNKHRIDESTSWAIAYAGRLQHWGSLDLENNSYLIEYDGLQHFQPCENFVDEEQFQKGQKRDFYKNQWCKDNNIPLIRIPYTHYDNLCIEDLLLETSKYRVI